MKKTHDVVASVGEYKNKQGETKKRYVNVGAAFEDDEGRKSIKLETIPVGPGWTGWLSLYEPRANDGQQPQRSTKPTAQLASATAPEDDDIPF